MEESSSFSANPAMENLGESEIRQNRPIPTHSTAENVLTRRQFCGDFTTKELKLGTIAKI